MKISPARMAAYDILLRIERDKAFSSALLPGYEDGLSRKDRSLCHQLVLGVLRKQLWLDEVIQSLTGGKKIDREILVILRLGLYQLRHLDKIPAYSAINESVELTKKARKSSAKGFVNAVLRKATNMDDPLPSEDPMQQLSLETSHPKWLLERWADQFGIDEAAAIARVNNSIPASAFRLTVKGTEQSVSLPDDMIRGSLVPAARISSEHSPELQRLAETGLIYFQDEGSQLVGQIVADQKGQKILDVCASPGSKTTQLALERRDKGHSIVAGDLHDQRVRFLRQNCLQQGAELVSVVQYDAEFALPFAPDSFDTVFIDAPCSGTGTIRHNPEIRYFLNRGDIPELSSKQLAILLSASKHVKPGGKLIYSTCSLEKEENESVVDVFLRHTNEYRLLTPQVNEMLTTERGFVRTFPHRHLVDGFFVALFERIKA